MTNAFRFIKPESENAIQASFFQWTELQKGKHPELVLFHSIPNGSHKSPVSRMIYKATGLKSGVPDCFLPVARGKHHGLYIEFKTKKGKTSEAQKWWHEKLTSQSFLVVTCHSVGEAIGATLDYLNS